MFCYEYSVMSGNVLFWTLHNILKCFVSKANYGFLSVDWESRSLTMGVRSDYFQTSINIYQIIEQIGSYSSWFFYFRICLLQWGSDQIIFKHLSYQYFIRTECCRIQILLILQKSYSDFMSISMMILFRWGPQRKMRKCIIKLTFEQRYIWNSEEKEKKIHLKCKDICLFNYFIRIQSKLS